MVVSCGEFIDLSSTRARASAGGAERLSLLVFANNIIYYVCEAGAAMALLSLHCTSLCLATKSHSVDRLFADARPEFAKNPLARVETTGNGLNVCMLKALIVFGTC
jgi:hypothetical protein